MVVNYPTTPREVERVSALDATHIFNSSPAAEFDEIVAVTRDQFALPICLVTLLDANRQWFKARCGIDVDGTDRDVAFCNYTILSDDVFVVEDAAADPRFSDNPLVTSSPYIRFYAGAPLTISPGLSLGSLCIIGTEPRKLTAAEAVTLRRLATIVVGLIRGHGFRHEASELAREALAQNAVLQSQSRDLRIRERRFRQTERIGRLGGWDLDIASRKVTWSDEVYRICDIAIGIPVDLDLALSVYPAPERKRLGELIRRAVSDQSGFDEEFEIVTKAGARKWVRAIGEVELDDHGPQRLFGTFQDVSEQHEVEERLWRAANCDSLTGLANRHRFDEMLAAAFEADRPAPGLLIVGADHVREINDTLGNDAGNELIRTIARRLAEAVGPTSLVGRVGGDEFGVLTPAPVTADAFDATAKNILGAMRPPFTFKGNRLKPSVSIGGSLGSLDGSSEVLRQSADLALSHAKSNRRGSYVFFHDDLRAEVAARIAAVDFLDDALASGEVAAWYQPIVELSTGQVTGFEALARVRDGDVTRSIGEFAHALQDPRTATRLTACIFERIGTDMVGWRAAGREVPRIAFNVGPLDFEEGEIEAMLMSTCERAQIEPRRLGMEVTESVFLSRDADIVAETAARLRARGVTVSLDDFGTGHASLAHLGTFPVDVIKMDRSFVLKMDDGGSGLVIAATLIDLAHKLGIQVVAEGVETDAQLETLMRLGCDKVQGYLVSRALAPENLVSFLDTFEPPHQLRAARVAGRLARSGDGRVRRGAGKLAPLS